MVWLRLAPRGRPTGGAAALLGLARWINEGRGPLSQALALWSPAALSGSGGAGVGASLWTLGLFFLKAGAVLYGSGYVLIAFLQGELVATHGWLTQQRLLDAIAIGQFTPGPVLSTASFIGYVVLGLPGAVIATVAIFLPSFLFVVALNRVIPRLRRSNWASAFMDAINVSAVGLMLAVTIELAQAAIAGWPTAIIAALAAAAALRWRVNAAWLVLGGAVLGWGLPSCNGNDQRSMPGCVRCLDEGGLPKFPSQRCVVRDCVDRLPSIDHGACCT